MAAPQVFYVNGALEGSNYVDTKTIKYDTAPLTIGAADGYAFFKGSIDDLRFYNRVLTASEIKTMYNDGIILKTNDNIPPTISLTYPVNGQMIYGPVTFSSMLAIMSVWPECNLRLMVTIGARKF